MKALKNQSEINAMQNRMPSFETIPLEIGESILLSLDFNDPKGVLETLLNLSMTSKHMQAVVDFFFVTLKNRINVFPLLSHVDRKKFLASLEAALTRSNNNHTCSTAEKSEHLQTVWFALKTDNIHLMKSEQLASALQSQQVYDLVRPSVLENLCIVRYVLEYRETTDVNKKNECLMILKALLRERSAEAANELLNLSGADLSGIEFNEVNFQNSNLQHANLSRVKFRITKKVDNAAVRFNFKNSNFTAANLEQISIAGVNALIDFSNSIFDQAKLVGIPFDACLWNQSILNKVQLFTDAIHATKDKYEFIIQLSSALEAYYLHTFIYKFTCEKYKSIFGFMLADEILAMANCFDDETTNKIIDSAKEDFFIKLWGEQWYKFFQQKWRSIVSPWSPEFLSGYAPFMFAPPSPPRETPLTKLNKGKKRTASELPDDSEQQETKKTRNDI